MYILVIFELMSLIGFNCYTQPFHGHYTGQALSAGTSS